MKQRWPYYFLIEVRSCLMEPYYKCILEEFCAETIDEARSQLEKKLEAEYEGMWDCWKIHAAVGYKSGKDVGDK